MNFVYDFMNSLYTEFYDLTSNSLNDTSLNFESPFFY